MWAVSSLPPRARQPGRPKSEWGRVAHPTCRRETRRTRPLIASWREDGASRRAMLLRQLGQPQRHVLRRQLGRRRVARVALRQLLETPENAAGASRDKPADDHVL